VLFHGGGNFGDVWPLRQAFRERVFTELSDLPIVQLPQTVSFTGRDMLQRAAQIVRAHPQLTILTRDHASTSVTEQGLGVPATLCPDMAFCLTLKRRGAGASPRTVYLIRTDKEQRRSPHRLDVPFDNRTNDWPQDSAAFKRWASRALASTVRHPRRLAHARLLLFNRLATHRMRRGLAVLESGSRVVTDRLHAHILCVLLDIPHRLLDNSYGKNRAFVEAWTADYDGLDYTDSRTMLKVAR
jgi:pyruvyl transferase EpsO